MFCRFPAGCRRAAARLLGFPSLRASKGAQSGYFPPGSLFQPWGVKLHGLAHQVGHAFTAVLCHFVKSQLFFVADPHGYDMVLGTSLLFFHRPCLRSSRACSTRRLIRKGGCHHTKHLSGFRSFQPRRPWHPSAGPDSRPRRLHSLRCGYVQRAHASCVSPLSDHHHYHLPAVPATVRYSDLTLVHASSSTRLAEPRSLVECNLCMVICDG